MKHAEGASPEDDALDIIEEHMSGEPESMVKPDQAESSGTGKSKRALKKVRIPPPDFSSSY